MVFIEIDETIVKYPFLKQFVDPCFVGKLYSRVEMICVKHVIFLCYDEREIDVFTFCPLKLFEVLFHSLPSCFSFAPNGAILSYVIYLQL